VPPARILRWFLATRASGMVLQRLALPRDGMKGDLPEYIIPNWLDTGSVMIERVGGVNPES
jgi:hypothetical protein